MNTREYEEQLSKEQSKELDQSYATSIYNTSWNVISWGMTIASSPLLVPKAAYRTFYPTPKEKIVQLKLPDPVNKLFEELPEFLQEFIAKLSDVEINTILSKLFDQSKKSINDHIAYFACDQLAIKNRRDSTVFQTMIKQLNTKQSYTSLFSPASIVLCELEYLKKYEMVLLENDSKYITSKYGFTAITTGLLTFDQLYYFKDANKISAILSEQGLAVLQKMKPADNYSELICNLAIALHEKLFTLEEALSLDLINRLSDLKNLKSEMKNNKSVEDFEIEEEMQEIIEEKRKVYDECIKKITEFFVKYDQSLPLVFQIEAEREKSITHLKEEIEIYRDQYPLQQKEIHIVQENLIARINTIKLDKKANDSVNNIGQPNNFFTEFKEDIKSELKDVLHTLKSFVPKS